MKYLKLFENYNTEDILDLCKDYLAYLFDDNSFKVFMGNNNSCAEMGGLVSNPNSNVLALSREHNNSTQGNPKPMTFYWDDIKDQFIPFIYVLNKKYTILNITFMSHVFTYKDIKLEDIEDGVNFAIRTIAITIKK